MKLSKWFTLEEMIRSRTGEANGIKNIPNDEQIVSIGLLCTEVLDKIRDHFASPLKVTSGFRCDKLNKLIGGAVNSQHTDGQAADFTVNGIDLKEVFNFCLTLDYDQLIYEFGSWIHISFKPEGNRKETLEAKMINNKKQYIPRGAF